ncbi:MAG: hypothetical protein ACOH1O_04755 [Flavobacterium sp.]
MESIIKIVIYVHAFFGSLGLLAGFASVIFIKGSPKHKLSGKIFSYSMILSSTLSLPICWLPKHENPFLFLIGIFTIYLVLSGNRILLFKKRPYATFIDKLISGTLFIGSIFMISLGCYYMYHNQFGGILYLVFGPLALMMSLRDFKFFRNFDKSKILKFHIGKMSGAFGASITAFLVAGVRLNGLIYWILPSIVMAIYMVYWFKKIGKSKLKTV